MNSGGDGGDSDANDAIQPELSSQQDRLPDLSEKDATRRESADINDEAALSGREEAATNREDVAHLRENAAAAREKAANLREEAVLAREGQAKVREGNHAARSTEVQTGDTIESASGDPLTMVREANAHLVISAIEAHRLTEQVEVTKAQLYHLAHHDVLTGLPNRLLLRDRLSQGIELARRGSTHLAVLFFDLDRFKHINDSLGHAVGDQLLRSVAQRVAACVRNSDTVSRQGGDEFIVLLPHIQQPENAAFIAQKILAAVAEMNVIDAQELHVTASIGISTYPDDGQDVETLIKSADTAMYHAKENGRNNYKFFVPEMNIQAVRRLSTESNLRTALERREFVLHYQPKIDLHTNRIIGAEALIRWQHPERGLVPPSQFVPIAEDCGLILPIGRWVLREACLQARVWREAGLPLVVVAVNTSVREFNASDFLENVRATLKNTGLDPGCLELELTETILMHDTVSKDSVLHSLANLGVKLAIDDFGTGYSSLSYLRQFPIHTLKIDQSFVSRMSSNADDATIVSAVISMGKSLKLRVIAEGVETAEQCAFLRAHHCDEGQGYYFSRPIEAEAFTALLRTGISTGCRVDD